MGETKWVIICATEDWLAGPVIGPYKSQEAARDAIERIQQSGRRTDFWTVSWLANEADYTEQREV